MSVALRLSLHIGMHACATGLIDVGKRAAGL